MSTARDAILGRIRNSLRDVRAEAAGPDAPPPRDYLRASSAPRPELVERFVRRVSEYKAAVHRTTAAELPPAIAAACARRNVRTLVVPADLPDGWAPTGLALLRDPGLSNEQLDTSGGVLTGCALGVAQTGTIILDGGPAQGRRAITLLPDYHVCVVDAGQIVDLVPEAVARLRDAAARPGRPLTWISGPSATSDIELSRVEGVHGPRTLEVFVVE